MKHRLRMTQRTRLQLVLLAVLSLLFQQAAFAAYVCSPASMPANQPAMAAHCHDMPMPQSSTHTQAAPVLCTQHCARLSLAAQDAHVPTVPPLLLPAVLPALPPVIVLPVSRTAHVHNATRRMPSLSPVLQHRVLLI